MSDRLDDKARRELRLLKGYALLSMPVLLMLSVAAFQQAGQQTRFDVIDVERINVIEKDGTLRLTISNRDRLPDPVIGGKSYPLRGGTGIGSAGLIFFNEEGNEVGGLVYQGSQTDSGFRASAHLTFDQFNQDEALSLAYSDQNGRRRAGMTITDRSNESIQAFAESAMVIRRLPEGPERTRRMDALRADLVRRGQAPAQRLYAGKGLNKESIVMLADPQGRPRIRLMVDSLGVPKLEFLDERGTVTYRLPQANR